MSEQTAIDAETLRGMLERGEPVTVLDVRDDDERAEWRVPGSIHVNAYEALKHNDPEALAGVDLPEDELVVTVCGAGKTSAIAAEQLRNRGLQAVSLKGGMKAWSLAWNTAEVHLAEGRQARVVQVRRTGKGCLSYIIESAGKAVVIDAALEPTVYLDINDDRGWEIRGVLDAHPRRSPVALAEARGAERGDPVPSRAGPGFFRLHARAG